MLYGGYKIRNHCMPTTTEVTTMLYGGYKIRNHLPWPRPSFQEGGFLFRHPTCIHTRHPLKWLHEKSTPQKKLFAGAREHFNPN